MGNSLKDLVTKTKATFKEEGVKSLLVKARGYITYQMHTSNKPKKVYKDILFINGCELPHPQRYRVDHQIEQLESFGVSCDKVFYADLTIGMLKYYRGFVFYRCPVLPVIEEFIKKAKENHKVCFYDIDDLVFDTKYTNQIKYLDTMSKSERKLYDHGVERMGKTMKLCDYGITSTTRLQTEMKKFFSDVCLNRNVASEAMLKYSDDALKQKHPTDKIIMGYFSGSITHNSDFELIMPTIVKLLKKYDNLYLKIVGLLDLPPEMNDVKDKIITSKFSNWTELPKIIRSVDINLAPLEDTIFNEAKSENKWTEAALVKVPTVASAVGAFKEVIKDKETGMICKNSRQWEQALSLLIEDQSLRTEIGNQAFKYARNNYVTTYSGKEISDFIQSKLKPNVFFVLPSTNISGGTLVAMQHAAILKRHGYDVTLINAEPLEDQIYQSGTELNVVSANGREFFTYVDTIVATMWVTLEYIRRFSSCRRRKYLVQNFETNFYEYNRDEKHLANATYNQLPGIEYITVSKWCESWLKDVFHDSVKYAPNGITPTLFPYRQRKFVGKTKILIEGDSKSFYKNVDESFKIIDLLDRSKFEIHYLSYEGEPKKDYQLDFFHHNIPHSEVAKIYQECDILLKSSTLESFSYPPLEMMATGGFCVVRPNEGNIEYLKDGENCLFYDPENLQSAVQQINRLVKDDKLRRKLAKGAKQTVSERDWMKVEQQVIDLYKERKNVEN